MPQYSAGEARLSVVPDASGFKRKLEADMRKIKAEFALDVTANTAQARADIDRFRELQRRNGIELGVDVELAKAQAEMDAWRARQKAAGLTVTVDADTGQARQQIERLGKQLDGGKILGALKWNAGALAIGSLPSAAVVLGQVTAAVQQLSQAGLALPGVYAGIAGSVGTAMLGFHGMKDAVEALNKASDGTPQSLKKADEALKSLSPHAAELVKTVVGLGPAFASLRKDIVQQNMFEGVSASVKTLADKDLPVLQKGLGGISTAWNGTLKQLAVSLGSDSSRGLLDRILGNTGDAQSRFNNAIDPIVHGVATLTAAGTDVLPRLADGLGKASDRFNRFITAADKDGRLDKWINDGITGLSHLGESMLNVGKSLTAVTKAVGGGEGLLSLLEQGTDKLQAFLNSDEGQAKLTQFFAEGKEQLSKWLPVLQNLVGILGSVYEGSKQWTNALLPALEQMTGFLSRNGDLAADLVTAFVAWKSIDGVTSLLGKINSIGGGLSALPGKASGAAGGISQALSKIAIPAVLAPVLLDQSSQMIGPNNSGASNLGGFGLNIAGGAALGGMAAGGPGAIVGAIVGLGASIYDRVLADIHKGQDEFERSWNEHHNDPQHQASVDLANQLTGRDAILSPSMAVNTVIPPSLVDAINKGAMPGYSMSKDGKVLGPDGKPIRGLSAPGTTLSGINTPAVAPPPLVPRVDGIPFPIAPPAPKPSLVPTQQFQLPPGTNPVVAGPTIAASSVTGEAKKAVDDLATSIEKLPTGQVVIKDASPEVISNLDKLGTKIEQLPDGNVKITANTDEAQAQLDRLVRDYQSRQINLQLGPLNLPGAPTVPGRARGGPAGRTPAGKLWGPGTPTSDSILGVDSFGMPTAFVSTGEGVVNHAAMQRPGVAALVAGLNGYGSGTDRRGVRGLRGFSGGTYTDQWGNPVLPGTQPGGPAPVAAAPDQGGGVMSAFGSFVSGLSGPIGNALSLGQGALNLGQQGGDGIGHAAIGNGGGQSPIADRFAQLPGLFGLFGSLGSSDPEALGSWGQKTGEWLGNFTAKTAGGFASALWTGALGLVGLDNSILSPSNPWFQDAAQVGQFGLSQDGFLGALFGGSGKSGGKGSRKGPTDKQVREANDKITDRDNAVERALQRLNELPPNAKQSTRTAAQDAYNKAVREAAEARDDLQGLMSGQTVSSASKPAGLSSNQGVVYQAMLNAGFPASEWSALNNILNKESGANPLAKNPTSGAFGAFQFLGHENDKYGALGAYSTDLGQQSIAGMQYIKDRYGTPSNAWSFWQANGWYENGGPTPPGRKTAYPAILHGDEFVISARGRATVPDAFLHALNTGQIDASMVPQFYDGGPTAYVPPNPNVPVPLPKPDYSPGPGAQGKVTSVAPAVPSPAPATVVPSAPGPASTGIGSAASARPVSVAPVAPGPASSSADAYNHNLAAINTGIDSTASVIGNAISTAMSIGSMGAGGAGVPGMGAMSGLASYAAGLAQQGGKIAKDFVNVGSSFLVGSVPGSLGTTDNAYGETLRPPQNVPQTAEYRGGDRYYNIQAGYRMADLMDELRLKEAQDSQAQLAQWSGV